MKSFFKETKIDEKIFKHAALNIIKTKEKRYFFSVTPAVFDIYLVSLTVGLPEGVENNHDKTESIKWSTTEPPHFMSYCTYKLLQFIETPTKQTMIAADEAVLTEALAL